MVEKVRKVFFWTGKKLSITGSALAMKGVISLLSHTSPYELMKSLLVYGIEKILLCGCFMFGR